MNRVNFRENDRDSINSSYPSDTFQKKCKRDKLVAYTKLVDFTDCTGLQCLAFCPGS